MDLQRDVLEDLKRHCTQGESNPARELGERLGTSQLNPLTHEVRGSIDIEAHQHQILDKLKQELPL